ncbi:MAG: hypothetical protein JNK37_21515 [Verrucomicrobiales bacterium]|nr:hypothetical protein [Verrucomicrobiales bacterium]
MNVSPQHDSSRDPAQSLAESATRLDPRPLGPDDPRYVPLGDGRGTQELVELEAILRNAARVPKAYAKCAFVGARGSGKSTYLLHLEKELQDEGLFTPIHIYLDASLESDCDYSDIYLWIGDQIAQAFQEADHPLDDDVLSRFTLWFADKAFTDASEWKKEIGLEASVEASARTGLPGIFSLKLLARLKSMIVGSETSRREIRRHVQNYATELRDLMDALLDHAREVLKKAGKPERLLIVQDNLDRITPREKAQHLFYSGGDMLVSIRADIIFTAPVAMNLAPIDIGRTFPHVITMPNVKVRLRNGDLHPAGIDSLVRLIDRRISIDLVFESPEVARYLAEKSGGSVRDLIRLLDSAQLKAQVAQKERVDQESAAEAVRKLSINFSRLLFPESVYFPILVEVHQTKTRHAQPETEATREAVQAAREFFAELMGNGSVLEYNGDDSWYDVHPAVCDTDKFKDALATATGPRQKAPAKKAAAKRARPARRKGG